MNFLRIFTLSLFVFLPLLLVGQTQLSLLEEAYAFHDKAKYKKSIKLFERYLQKNKGNKKDYYFIGVAYAQIGKKKAALKYLNLASIGIESYGMMLADSKLKKVHSEILIFFNALKEFYEFKDSSYHFEIRLNLYYDKEHLRKVDSLYNSLPIKKVDAIDLLEIAYLFDLEKDTSKVISYLVDAIHNMPVNRFARKVLVDNSIEILGNKYIKELQKIIPIAEEGEDWTGKVERFFDDDLRPIPSLLEIVKNPTSALLVHSSIYFNIALGYVSQKDYEQTVNYLMQALDAGFNDFKYLFKDYDLRAFYASNEGQSFIKYFIANNYGKVLDGTNNAYVVTGKGITYSKRTLYNYLENNSFNVQIPKYFDRYEIILGEKKGEIIHVPHGWYDELSNPKIPLVFSETENKQIKIEINEKLDTLIFFGSEIKNNELVDVSGLGFLFPHENKLFFDKIIANTIEMSNITVLQQKHFAPLFESYLKSKLLTIHKSRHEDVAFSIRDLTNTNANTNLNKLFQKTRAENLGRVSMFLKNNKFYHTEVLERMIKLLKDTTYYLQLPQDKKDKFEVSINQMDELLFFDKLSSGEIPNNENIKKLWSDYRQYAKIYSQKMYELGEKYETWWEDYKKENPYKVPELHLESLPLSKKLDDYTFSFFIDEDSKEPAFYNSYKQEVLLKDAVFKVTGGKYLKGISLKKKSILFAPAGSTNPKEVFTLADTNTVIVQKIIDLADTLVFKNSEKAKNEDRFNKKYNRFFVYPSFGKYLCLSHTNDTLFLSAINPITNQIEGKTILHSNLQVECGDNKPIIETIKSINSLNALEFQGHFYVLYSANVSKSPYCRDWYTQRHYLAKIDKDLKVKQFIAIPDKFEDNFKRPYSPFVSLKIIGERLVTLIYDDHAKSDYFFQIFDLNLTPISKLNLLNNNVKQESAFRHPIGSVAEGNSLYIVHTLYEFEEQFLVLRRITLEGNISNPIFLVAIPEGFIISDSLVKLSNKVLRYDYIKFNNSNQFHGSININLNDFKFE